MVAAPAAFFTSGAGVGEAAVSDVISVGVVVWPSKLAVKRHSNTNVGTERYFINISGRRNYGIKGGSI